MQSKLVRRPAAAAAFDRPHASLGVSFFATNKADPATILMELDESVFGIVLPPRRPFVRAISRTHTCMRPVTGQFFRDYEAKTR